MALFVACQIAHHFVRLTVDLLKCTACQLQLVLVLEPQIKFELINEIFQVKYKEITYPRYLGYCFGVTGCFHLHELCFVVLPFLNRCSSTADQVLAHSKGVVELAELVEKLLQHFDVLLVHWIQGLVILAQIVTVSFIILALDKN